jgi:hypothetical protein
MERKRRRQAVARSPKQARPAPAPAAVQAAPASPGQRILELQRSAGNAAVAAALTAPAGPASALLARFVPVVVPGGGPVTHPTEAELKAKTLSEFDEFATKQADWHADKSIGSTAFRNRLRKLLEIARATVGDKQPVLGGCGDMKVDTLLTRKVDSDSSIRKPLQLYGLGVTQGEPTVEIEKTNDIDKALRFGNALVKLQPVLGGPVLKKIMKQKDSRTELEQLIAAGLVDHLIRYVKTCKPVLHANNGSEIESFILLVKTDSVDPVSLKGKLKNVRNFHRFEGRAIKKLLDHQKNTAKKDPFTLILHSAFDHNGAFHRDPNLSDVIERANKVTLMVEGSTSLSEMRGHIAPLAKKYGVSSQIEEVMLAGHGNARSMQMAGKLDANGDEVHERVVTNTPETDKLMKELLTNMASGPKARIVLNACLTASNSVNAPLDADPKKAAKQVQDAIAAQPSLTTYVQMAAAKEGVTVDVKGSNASFGRIPLMDAGGQLDLDPGSAAHLTSTKLQYVEFGGEPQGAMRAVLEEWAKDQLATPPTKNTLDAIDRRLTRTAGSTVWDEAVIRSLYSVVKANPGDGELIRVLGEPAGTLSEMPAEEDERKPSKIDEIPGGHANAILGGLVGADQWTAIKSIPLAIFQKWMRTDTTKRASFLTQLTKFNCSTAQPFVEIDYLDTNAQMGPMLPVAKAAAPPDGELMLSLLGVNADPIEAKSKDFLLAVIGASATFPPAIRTKIDTFWDGVVSPADVEKAIGRGTATPPVGGGVGGATNAPNVDLDGDGTNDFYITPMTRRGAVAARRLNVREQPDLAAGVVAGLSAGARVELIGESGDWYGIEHKGRTRFVHKDWVKLSATP